MEKGAGMAVKLMLAALSAEEVVMEDGLYAYNGTLLHITWSDGLVCPIFDVDGNVQTGLYSVNTLDKTLLVKLI